MSVTAEKQRESFQRLSPESVREALAKVMASDLFSRSAQQSKLLSYLCEQVLSGSANDLKEYTIAVEAMGLPPDYGQTEASTVRVAIHRLRKRLKSYYELHGSSDRIEICLSAGEYTPRFILREFNDERRIQNGESPPDAVASTPVSTQPLQDAQPPELPHFETPAVLPKSELEPLVASPFSPPIGSTLRWIVAAVVLAILVLSYSFWRSRHQSPKPSAGNAADRKTNAATPALLSAAPVRILVGASGPEYTDKNGNLWISDRYFKGGQAYAASSQRSTDRAPLVKRINDQTLVQHYRAGENFSYEIPVRPGIYELLLGFSETVFGPDKPAGGGENERIFTVKINGNNVIDRLDVYSDAGGSDVLDVRRFADVTPSDDGKVHLQLSTTSGNPAVLSFIELIPQAGARANPLRISTRDKGLVDNMGQSWDADLYYLGGRSQVVSRPISGTPIPELYVGERFGNFSYTLPVPQGRRYRLALYFAERYFGSDKANDKSGVGARVFDVTCNGTVLLRDFDILKEAGLKDRPIVKTFTGLSASPQGKLSISFVPSRNYALVNAVEVTEDAP